MTGPATSSSKAAAARPDTAHGNTPAAAAAGSVAGLSSGVDGQAVLLQQPWCPASPDPYSPYSDSDSGWDFDSGPELDEAVEAKAMARLWLLVAAGLDIFVGDAEIPDMLACKAREGKKVDPAVAEALLLITAEAARRSSGTTTTTSSSSTITTISTTSSASS